MSGEYHEGYRRRGREPSLPADVSPFKRLKTIAETEEEDRCSSQEDFLKKMRALVVEIEEDKKLEKLHRQQQLRGSIEVGAKRKPILTEHDHAMYRAYCAMNMRKRKLEQEKLMLDRVNGATEIIKAP